VAEKWYHGFFGLFRPKVCDHKQNFVEKTWKAADGTPMTYFHCLDCGFTDEGHVHADGCDWPDRRLVFRGGVFQPQESLGRPSNDQQG
jgi:hypothetical protein